MPKVACSIKSPKALHPSPYRDSMNRWYGPIGMLLIKTAREPITIMGIIKANARRIAANMGILLTESSPSVKTRILDLMVSAFLNALGARTARP
jgi:hypothetical protein